MPVLDSFPVSLLVSTALGFLTGLGTGGGSLLMLWLTLVLNLEYDTARTLNLLFYLPSAAAAGFFHIKKGNLPVKKIWPAILSGAAAAEILSLLLRDNSLPWLKKLFGIFLIASGIRELFYRPRKAR